MQLDHEVPLPSFALQEFEQERKSRRVRVLSLMLVGVIVFTAFFVFIIIRLYPIHPDAIKLASISLLTQITALLITFRGHPKLAAVLVSSLMWVIYTITIYLTGGLQSPIILSQFFIVIMVGILIGSKMAFIFAGASMLSQMGLFIIEQNYALPTRIWPESLTVHWIAHSIFILMGATFVYISNQEIRTALAEVQQREDELRRLAMMDHLTGIFNRRFFFTFAEREFSRSLRYNLPLAFLMIDVDHFKQINDTHGHAMGDRVLRSLAEYLQESIRENDILCRFGGEEFAILLPHTDISTAALVAERLRTLLQKIQTETSKGIINPTISVGISGLENKPNTLDEMLENADNALYKAKQLGRNQVVVFHAPTYPHSRH